jgi:antitoxin component of MazEF toxin-antitoxin module
MQCNTRRTDKKGRVTLPSSFANHLVIIEQISDDELRIRRAKAVPRKYTLAQLLSGITTENLHGEIDTGPSKGNEAW